MSQINFAKKSNRFELFNKLKRKIFYSHDLIKIHNKLMSCVLWLGLLTIGPLGLPANIAGVAHAADAESTKSNWPVSTSILSKIPSAKATVGVIPYYTKNNQVYILLGRERIDSGKEKSGKFSDFGGKVELDGTTFAHNAIRELREETICKISLNEKDLYENGNILYLLSTNNRDVIYIFYPMSEHEYKITRSLNSLWPVLCAHKKDSVECEKDQFTWFNVQDISNKSNKVRDIDGNASIVKLREYFAKDCLGHTGFSKMLERISRTTALNRCVNSLG